MKEKKKKEVDPNFDKEKAKLDKFDPRGVQTLFRTLSRNHYNLLKMVDNKASIILTVNSIIISLLMGAIYIVPEEGRDVLRITARILINFSMLSMIFAIISMLPHKYLGTIFRNSSYKGSLYAGNFSSQSLEEFQTEMDRIIANGNTVYQEMTIDLYFLGKAIARKQRILLFSAAIFLMGLIGAATYSFINLFGTLP